MSRFRLTLGEERCDIAFDDGRMNLLSVEALEELCRALRQLPSSTRLLVFRSGRAPLFAAGADMASMRRFDAADAERFAERGQRTFEEIASLPFATAVLIDGDCFGGALDLCLAFDCRVATRRSRFAHPGAKIGIVTGFGGTVRLPRLATRPGAAQMLLGNVTIGADAANEIGVIDAVVDDLAGADDYLARLAQIDRATLEVVRLIERSPVNSSALHLLARRTAQLHSFNR